MKKKIKRLILDFVDVIQYACLWFLVPFFLISSLMVWVLIMAFLIHTGTDVNNPLISSYIPLIIDLVKYSVIIVIITTIIKTMQKGKEK